MRYGIVINPRKMPGPDALDTILGAFEEKNATLLFDPETAAILSKDPTPIEEMDAEAIVVVGGDGTILHTLQRTSRPVFPINMGELGFLTEVGLEDASGALSRLFNGELNEELHIRLAVELNGERQYDCTNEAVIHTAQVSKIREFEIKVNGKLAQCIRADGVIIATPTGSTCYLMSVGGPIIDPRVDAFATAPIAPFKLGSRPLVVPASAQVELRQKSADATSILVLDGQNQFEIDHRDTIRLYKSDQPARFLRLNPDFYKNVREKLENTGR